MHRYAEVEDSRSRDALSSTEVTSSEATKLLHDAIFDHPDKPVLGSFLGVLSSYGDHPGVESLPEVILIAVESGLKAAGLPALGNRPYDTNGCRRRAKLPEHRSISTVSPVA